jgi:hypothetical protein
MCAAGHAGGSEKVLHSPGWSSSLLITATDPPLNDPIKEKGEPHPHGEELCARYPTVLRFIPWESGRGSLPAYLSAAYDADCLPPGLGIRGFRLEVNPEATAPALRVPVSWREALPGILSDVAKGGSVAVCGSKNAGKSTCSRLLVNRLLSMGCPRVALLDCDAGQPELTPPGLVSLRVVESPLLAPPYAHMRPAYRSYFLGDVTAAPEPVLFTAYASELVEVYRRDLAGVPLVINTDGWVKGLGQDLLNSLLELLAPQHVIRLQGSERCAGD